MGKEIIINTLEDWCDLLCGSAYCHRDDEDCEYQECLECEYYYSD